MDPLSFKLGLTTAISRLELERAPNADATVLRRRLSLIEAAMPAFNLDPSAVHIAAEIAGFDDALTADRRVALIMLILASMVALSEGSTRLPVTGPLARDPMLRILGPLCAGADGGEDRPRAAEMAHAIARMLEEGAVSSVIGHSPDEYRPLLYLPPFIYHQRIRAAELRLADRLRPLMRADGALTAAREVEAAIADVCARPQWIDGREIILSSEQRAAVRASALHRLTIISGGPGTGKTSIVLAIVRLLARLGIGSTEFALAAPTGKAAHRMGESVREGLEQVRDPAAADQQLAAAGVGPQTVHRLLGFSPAREVFLHHGNNPMSAKVVIVDECSMLDLNLMQRLAGALRSEARLVLIGDADQLPSVAAGEVFRDLVSASAHRTDGSDSSLCTRLTQSYRMNQADDSGRAIFDFAERINRGVLSSAEQTAQIQERAAATALRFAGVELVDPAQSSLDEFLDHWYSEKVRDSEVDALADRVYTYGEDGFDRESSEQLRRLQSRSAAWRILCVTRVLTTGAERINAAMHRRAAAAANRLPEPGRFLPGEPVMIVRNDYERNLFNGDQGIIAQVAQPDGSAKATAVFIRGDRCDVFHPASLGEGLELCYATTIHKGQGSEFVGVAVVLPDRSLPLLTRELLYTAVSRARKSVVVVGSVAMVQAAIARKGMRYCGLAELLEVGAADTSG